MSKVIVGFIISVSKQECSVNAGTIDHICQSTRLICISALLDHGIRISMLKHIIHGIDMQQIIGFLSVYAGIIGIRAIWVCGNLQIRTVDSQHPKSVISFMFVHVACKMLEQTLKCFW